MGTLFALGAGGGRDMVKGYSRGLEGLLVAAAGLHVLGSTPKAKRHFPSGLGAPHPQATELRLLHNINILT